jgi:Rap1a immunity proteins
VKLIALAFLIFCFAKAYPQVVYGEGKGNNGRVLLADCQGKTEEIESCVSYIEGVNDGWNAAMSSYALVSGQPNDTNKLCVRDGFTAGQLKNVVVAYGEVHPEVLDFGAELLVSYAIQNAFPCPKKK